MNSEFDCYFTSKKNYIRCRLTREHEYYLWKFQKLLRKEESSRIGFLKLCYRTRKNILGSRLGLTIPEGVFGKGLRIWHYGNIVVNKKASVGCNCQLHGDNCIGNNGKTVEAPVIGNNVDIGVGAKIIGPVVIADNIKIGAGAVVITSFTEEGITIGGVPARKLK